MKTKKIFKLLFCLILFSTDIFACTVVAGSNIIYENKAKVSALLTIALIFFIATMVLHWFRRSWESFIFIIISGTVLGLCWLSSGVGGDCGDGAVYSSMVAIAVTFVCFLAQFITWLMFRKNGHAELS